MFFKHFKMFELSRQLNLVYSCRNLVPYAILYSVTSVILPLKKNWNTLYSLSYNIYMAL